MSVFFFFFGIFQCVVFYFLGKTGDKLRKRAAQEWEQARYSPPHGWPSCVVIVPVAGHHPLMEAALESLAIQNYPGYSLYLVTATYDDPAIQLIDKLQRRYSAVRHVVAGHTPGRGQKNHNLLAGIDAAPETTEVYVFCDSTHLARPDFLRCLISPLARREAAFTTGYHEVEPRDQKIVTLAYSLSVLFMHFMQGSPAFTQPWGGAMAMSRQAFIRYHVRNLWEDNVVDDCSLGALLGREHIQVRLCPGAILQTFAAAHAFPVWKAWLERQILFLKFCMPGEWLSLSLVCCLMVIPPIWCAIVCLDGILGLGADMPPFLALCWFCVIGWTIGSWRRFLPASPAITRWLWAFFCASFMFTLVWLGSLTKKTLLWNNIVYQVGKGGKVLSVKRH